MDNATRQRLASGDFRLAAGDLDLRPWRVADAAAMVQIVADPAIPRWTFLPVDMTTDQALSWIRNRETQRREGSGFALAITTRDSDEVIGCVGLAGLEDELGPEAYYWLAASARGRGAVTRALQRVCRWAFDDAEVARVRLLTEPDNQPSCRVAERVGFVREGRLRRAAVNKQGQRGDLLLYGLLPEDAIAGDGGRRRETLERVTAAVLSEQRAGHVVTVAVDGVDGAGKSVFADELAEELRQRGVVVLNASIDGFHHPPEVRYRRGRNSPEGFFLDSYDEVAFRQLLVEPLREGGDRQIVRQIYDVHVEGSVEREVESAADVEVLVVDGIFLHRPELRDLWDLSVFLDVGFEVSIPRGAGRGYGDPDPADVSNRRYVEGQRLYLTTCHPHRHATWVIDNNILADAHIIASPQLPT